MKKKKKNYNYSPNDLFATFKVDKQYYFSIPLRESQIALDLKPEVTQGCGFESRLRKEVHNSSPGAAQSAAHCSKCALGWVKCREHISLLIILCIIVYVTNKAHLSLICIIKYDWWALGNDWIFIFKWTIPLSRGRNAFGSFHSCTAGAKADFRHCV